MFFVAITWKQCSGPSLVLARVFCQPRSRQANVYCWFDRAARLAKDISLMIGHDVPQIWKYMWLYVTPPLMIRLQTGVRPSKKWNAIVLNDEESEPNLVGMSHRTGANILLERHKADLPDKHANKRP